MHDKTPLKYPPDKVNNTNLKFYFLPKLYRLFSRSPVGELVRELALERPDFESWL